MTDSNKKWDKLEEVNYRAEPVEKAKEFWAKLSNLFRINPGQLMTAKRSIERKNRHDGCIAFRSRPAAWPDSTILF